jgi:hypothetical protein
VALPFSQRSNGIRDAIDKKLTNHVQLAVGSREIAQDRETRVETLTVS